MIFKSSISYKPSVWECLTDEPIKPIVLNICIDHRGLMMPRKGHPKHNKSMCKWKYDGQVFVHD